MPSTSHADIKSRAAEAARHEVDGFLYHDLHEYRNTRLSFERALKILLDGRANYALSEAAREKTEVLRLHDKVEESAMSKKEKLSSPLWLDVLRHAEKEAELLGIPKQYAVHKAEFYKLHGQGITKFRERVYCMEQYFVSAITGDHRAYLMTAPIYLTCIAFHDMRRMLEKEEHDKFAVSMMRLNYTNYAYTILRAMNGKMSSPPIKIRQY